MKKVFSALTAAIFILLLSACNGSSGSESTSGSSSQSSTASASSQSSTASASSSSIGIPAKTSYDFVNDWKLICPMPWQYDITTSGIIGGTRTLERCVYNNLSAPLKTRDYRTDGSLKSETFNVVFFTDSSNSESLTSKTVRYVLNNEFENMIFARNTDIHYNDVDIRWESVNNAERSWYDNGSEKEVKIYYNLQHSSGMWDDPLKSWTYRYEDYTPSYQILYEEVEDPDHWRSVVTSNISYYANGNPNIRYKDYLIKQDSSGYWHSFPTNMVSWVNATPPYQNGAKVYDVVQQPATGNWESFIIQDISMGSDGSVTSSKYYEIYFDSTCNCYKSRQI